MNATDENRKLWITVIVEAVMIVLVGLYNMYEVRQVSDQVQGKIEALSAYSAEQGKKIDKILTSLEKKYGEDFAVEANDAASEATDNSRVIKALQFIDSLKAEPKNAQPDESPNLDSADAPSK